MPELVNIHKSFGELNIFSGLDMSFKEGSITSILGPSGCGKTTLLKIAAGLLKPDRGEIVGMENKRAGFLFQETRLLPWKNTIDNLQFVLPDTLDKKERLRLCLDIMEKVGLKGYEKLYPAQLSGGMNQRLAMARAFIVKSDILFMDEPFQSLDLKIRAQMISMFKKLWLSTKPAILMVTHDVHEALLLSDKIYILSDKPAGILLELDNPMPFSSRTVKNQDLYRLEQEIINKYILL
ncbi:MAG: ABC transporter ATP-binding protein [Clostridiaceae bacterium]|jgi:NitT/TauT family transport system ATP-binding protein|nr:ABC transporter ATP-binding protein [Clostridiaceae bacterium]